MAVVPTLYFEGSKPVGPFTKWRHYAAHFRATGDVSGGAVTGNPSLTLVGAGDRLIVKAAYLRSSNASTDIQRMRINTAWSSMMAGLTIEIDLIQACNAAGYNWMTGGAQYERRELFNPPLDLGEILAPVDFNCYNSVNTNLAVYDFVLLGLWLDRQDQPSVDRFGMVQRGSLTQGYVNYLR